MNKALKVRKFGVGSQNPEEARKLIPDLQIAGDTACWVLLHKEASEGQGFLYTTMAMDTGNGVVLKCTALELDYMGGKHLVENVTFLPGTQVQRVQDTWQIVSDNPRWPGADAYSLPELIPGSQLMDRETWEAKKRENGNTPAPTASQGSDDTAGNALRHPTDKAPDPDANKQEADSKDASHDTAGN